jgi:hypothetical protein
MSRPCPACTAACEKGSGGEVLGFLFPSMDYPSLLHCNCCGAYYRLARETSYAVQTLSRVEGSRLANFREVPG